MVALGTVFTPAARGPAVEAGFEIIVDDLTPGGLVLAPPAGWRESAEADRSYGGSSKVALADGQAKTATFVTDIPQTGKYEVSLYWTTAVETLRSSSVPVAVHDVAGWKSLTVSQVGTQTGFNSLGTYHLEAGKGREVVRISTEGVPPSTTVHVAVDAMKLVKVAD